MTETPVLTSIVDNIIDEISTQLPYRDINHMYSYLESITSRHIFHLIKREKRYILIHHYDNNNIGLRYKYGSNMFIIILPAEGQVIITTLDIIKNISGLSMWITTSQLQEKILQFDIYNYNTSAEPVKSPRIIVTDLPSHSLTLIKNVYPVTSGVETISIHELLMGAL